MRILVTDPIADAGLERLRESGHEVVTDYELDGDPLVDAIADVNGLIVRSGTQVTEEVLAAGENLIIVGRAGIGVDNIDIDAATEHGVIVANAPEGNVRAAAEHTVAMAFASARSIPQAHARLKAGEWAKGEFLGTEINDKTLGIVGLGRVGQEVAKRLRSLGMDLVAYDPYISEDRADRLGAELVEFEACLERADFLTVHTPLTPETEDLISDEELALLEGGYLVNCARGGVVDEAALARAVEDGTLAGAAIDVFAEEPVSPDNPLLDVEDVIVTPHLGASTEAAQENVAVSTAEQVLAAFKEEPVLNALNAPSIDESAFPRVRPYIEIAETAGTIATQLLDGRIESVDVRYEGEIAEEEVDLVTASALKGVFSPLEWQVNAVNAPQIAEDRGVEVTETKTHQSEDFRSAITVSVGDGEETLDVMGTLFAGDDPRLVRIDGFRVDAIPHGHMLISRNYDEPGVIGLVATTLGDNDVNIAGMFNARESIGGEAITVYDLDERVPEEVIDRLEADERIIEARYITLDGAETVRRTL
ncbi:phosphoglycerate dehydrogenase [Halalkalicoccus salilacus]|uniref:phosphoglycerate dehydrogenase n=1 Tax=Halalkalicoccus salilacus TaxID=3117459 RepID=UPI00300EF0AB